MGTLGEDIKAAREKKGLTLRQLSEKTRISLTFLKALEDEDYSVIPGDVFVVGFIRNCARELGLNEKEVIARYKEQQRALTPAQQPEEKPAETEIKSAAMKAGSIPVNKRRPLYLVLMAGLVLGGILTAVALYMTRPAPVPPAPKPVPVPAPAPMRPMTTAVLRHVNVTTAKPPEVKPAPKTGLLLRLIADDKSWYSYKSDKGEYISGLLEKGKTFEVKADERIVLSLGSAGDVKVEYNGKALKPFGAKGVAVRGLVFTDKIEGVVMPPKKKTEQ
jgi:transcriptional regulator with XRE-family HTH domain